MMPRILSAQEITKAVAEMVIEANLYLPEGLEKQIRQASDYESNEIAREVLGKLCENMDAARSLRIPICQDTGMVVVFAEVGQQLLIDGDFEQAVHAGVAEGYINGYLRCSVVADPLRRSNTGNNTPAVIHTKLVPGDKLQLTVSPKGFGSENMSRIKMFNPSASREDILDFIVQTVTEAGGNPCPPVVVGVGIGGDFEYAAMLSKKALCRDVDCRNSDPYYAALEAEALARVNATGVGPQGFGGDTTALAINIEVYPTHIAGLPVAVNMGCHVTRHATRIL